MNITSFSLRRPAVIVIGVVLIVLLGLFAYFNIGTGLFPSTNQPVVSVSVVYPGGTAEEIANEINQPIENAVSGVAGLEMTRSYAGSSFGYVTATFRMSADPDRVLNDLQQSLANIADRLPPDASHPTIVKQDINDMPIMILSLSGVTDQDAGDDLAEKIRYELKKVKGVGDIRLQGSVEPVVRIQLDKDSLDRHGIPVNAILLRLQAENVMMPAGHLTSSGKDPVSPDLNVMFQGNFKTTGEIGQLIFLSAQGMPVRLDQLASIRMIRPADQDTVRMNGKGSTGIFIRKQKDANIISTAKRIRHAVETLRSGLPPGAELVEVSDSTEFVRSTLNETKRNLLEGILMTALVLVFFLRQWRSSLIVLISIPASLLGVTALMLVSKCTFNIFTLSALVMSIGILVDDSIVVLENIHRHLQKGKEPALAALDGRMEISRAAVAITLCDVVVFAPFVFMHDLVGQFFRQFGLTVVFASLFSLLVSFTITPLLAALLYKKNNTGSAPSPDAPGGLSERLYQALVHRPYTRALAWALENRWKVIAGVLALFAAAVSLIPLKVINTEFMPVYDQGRIAINLTAENSTDIRETTLRARMIEERLSSVPEVRNFLTIVGIDNDPARARIIVNLVPKNKRDKSQADIIRTIRSWSGELEPDRISVVNLGLVEEYNQTAPIVITVTASAKSDLDSAASGMEETLKGIKGLVDIENTASKEQTLLEARIKRDRAAQAGLSAWEISEVLRTALSGIKAGVYRNADSENDIIVGFKPGQTGTVDQLKSLKILARTGPIRLSDVLEISETTSAAGVHLMNGRKAVILTANIQDRPMGQVNRDIRDQVKAMSLPGDSEIDFGGDQDLMADSFASMIRALIASILLVYLILVILYGSFLTPLIRMLSIPCGIIGSLAALALTGKSLSLICLIGFIMLDGIVSKNGTLLIDYTNTLMKRGLSLRDAIRDAGATRIRPILMTSVTMITGMLPLALSLGDGSELKSGMAVVLIGGLVASTFISPILLPVVYTLIDDLRKSFSRNKGATAISYE
jgi:HAE1 family hydrophobic/amphiphilic exporter-1